VIPVDALSAADREQLIALLSDYDLLAVQEDDLTSPRFWTAHFVAAASRDAAADALSLAARFDQLDVRAIDVEDEDWARRTQADLPAVRVGNVIVAPPWDIPSPEPRSSTGSGRPEHVEGRTPSPVLVIIEPSRGFGTGHHQSTRLCLTLLQNRDLRGRTMIDVGTGSGVLAITAAKLGAAYVVAIDVDPDAIENARENIATNEAGAIVEAHVEDFTTSRRAPADVVTANLTGSLLARHAVDFARFVRPAGSLIVSGFNVEERRMVEEAFAPQFAIQEAAEEEGWEALVLSPERG
jgi:ribosomal protein L11 methyltransferase